jgi:L-alanine-DL-glutamate epimerase-like enolase superfamily enzyme
MNKRDFIKNGLFTAGGVLMSGHLAGSAGAFFPYKDQKMISGKLSLKFTPYTLQLKHTFTLSTSSRTTTPVVLTEIGYKGISGYGEASMPPYLGESHESVMKFLSLLNISQFTDPFLTSDILEYVENVAPGNYAAKASVDIALHDLIGKLLGKTCYQIFGLNPDKAPVTSFTIGLDTPEIVKQKVAEAEPYKLLKVKLGRDTDKEMVEAVRSCTDKPLCADVNQGWKDRRYALEMAGWLKEKGVVFLEQPMPKEQMEDIAWLTAQSPIPVIGDEGIRNTDDLVRQRDVYSGVNIKLMKCGGLSGAMKMIDVARAQGMKVMIGCMTETSCAVTAAAQLSPLADWCDLDGNLLIYNDPFEGLKIAGGKIILPKDPGIGVKKVKPV